MTNSEYETKKRLELAQKELERLKANSLGIFLAGSVAYAPNVMVNENSDLDLVVVVQSLKGTLENLNINSDVASKLKNRYFEGYCLKEEVDKVPVSIHFISSDAFDIISKCFVADIRVFRPKGKDDSYNLYGFERNVYNYVIKNIPLKEMQDGVRTIVPVAFINNDRYYLGVHRDKMLSNPIVFHDPFKVVSCGIERTWTNVTQQLRDESVRLYGGVDLSRMNVLNALAKRDMMNPDIVASIEDKTKLYLSRCL